MAFKTTGRAEYIASSGQTSFTFAFRIFVDTDITVYQTAAGLAPDSVRDLLVLDTDYTVTINGENGGTVTLLTGATLNDAVTLQRDLEVGRSIEYQARGDLTASNLNDDQEYQTYLIADLNDKSTTNTFTLDPSAQGINTVVPAPNPLYFLQWNSTGTALENVNSLNAGGSLWTAADVYTKTEQDIIDDAQDAAIVLKATDAEVIHNDNTDETKIGSLTIGESITVTNWEYSSYTITLTVASHNAKAGDTIHVSGLVADVGDSPNGSWSVASVTSTTIVYASSFIPTATADTGTTVSSALVKYGDLDVHGRIYAGVPTKLWEGSASASTITLDLNEANLTKFNKITFVARGTASTSRVGVLSIGKQIFEEIIGSDEVYLTFGTTATTIQISFRYVSATQIQISTATSATLAQVWAV